MKDFPHARLAYLTEPTIGNPVLNVQTVSGEYPLQYRLTINQVIGLIRDGAKMLRPYAEERA